MASTAITEAKLAKFLEFYSEHGNITKAAREAGIARSTVMKKRRHDEEFSELFNFATDLAIESLEDVALERARGWEEERVDKKGNVYTTKKHSDLLAIFMLKAMKPEKYKDRIQQDTNMTFENGPRIVVEIPSNGRE